MGLSIDRSQPTGPRADEAAFSSSLAGKAFTKGSGERWVRAAVAFATDPECRGCSGKAHDSLLQW